MQLFHSPASPFVRKVMIVLHETGQLDEVELLKAAVSPVTTGDPTLLHNPLGKLPTLIRDEGGALYDSRVICRYLNARAGGGLYPESRIWDVLTLEATGDGICDAAVSMVYEARFRDEAKRNPDWVAGQWGKITRALDVLSDRWASHLAGPLDAGQIAVGAALGYLDFRLPDRSWRDDRAGLASWFATMSERPSFQATLPQG